MYGVRCSSAWLGAVGATFLALALAVVGASSKVAIPTSGHLGETRVDADIARYYLEEYRVGIGAKAEWNRRLDRWLELPSDRLFEKETLREIADASGSVDLAALLFATAARRDPLQAEFERRRLAARRGERAGDFPYLVVFVPGWLYESHRENGADFAAPRALLDRLGIEHRLVRTRENGSIENNASLVAATLSPLCRRGRGIVVVSASKGGPEVALALSAMGPEVSGIVAWINIGGLLGGSRLADRALEPPRSWFVDLVLWWNGWERDGLESLTTEAARRWRGALRLPRHLLVVSLVSVPLSGDVSKRARDGYRALREEGPNDGLTLLADAVVPGGKTLVVPGSDHFFRPAVIDQISLAILRTVEVALADSRPVEAQSPVEASASAASLRKVSSSP